MSMKFGLFGTGYWAEYTQGAALVAHPGAELVGVWGRDPAKAVALAGRLNTRAEADADELIAEAEAVAIALPPDVQAGIAERAAAAGRHLLLDKPLAISLEAADRVVAAAERSGVASVVFFTARFMPSVETVLRHVVDTGGWFSARATSLASIFGADSPYANSQWRHERGGLWDIGPHALASILPVLGEVESVAALDGPHGTTHALLKHISGATSALTMTLDAPPAATLFESVFHGESGTMSLPDREGSPATAFGVAIDELLEAAAMARPSHRCDVRFARDVTAVLAAADRARSVGETTRL
jgi:predicted dehydrogenase